jgi:hypothetical protein
MLILKRSITAAVVALIASSISLKASAQLPFENWQVQTDPVDCLQQKLEKRLLEAYLGGGINSFEYASLRGDMESFMDRENVARWEHGLAPSETAGLLNRLELLRAEIEDHVADKRMLANITERVAK